ncbi:hypothetical protein AtEden1_Chr3g0198181 [Arabidopsis thaliana]
MSRVVDWWGNGGTNIDDFTSSDDVGRKITSDGDSDGMVDWCGGVRSENYVRLRWIWKS